MYGTFGVILSVCRTVEILHRYGERIIRKIIALTSPQTQKIAFFALIDD
ncbi:hypothetical protein XBJ1_4133 [Xenorhabdus bovienii SS-2004]|uniref:Uncharacterized protein n=1 Tax=Xenorhabdus bovienii (strain SS-2004) TaxID=406818 RepID=D3V6G6_XENBS|nr:hypothetical protein XBJ1_4133 [Xenorhabdus bovienii SS-2004]